MKKTKMKIKAMVMAVIMVISGIGIIPIKADAAGRKIVKKLTVTQDSLELQEGESESIKYKVTAAKGTSRNIVIKVSDKKVISAKVSGKKIVVRAKKKGESTITVMTRAKNKNGKRIAKKIRVVVENESYDDDELEYDFEDNEAYEDDETTEVSMPENTPAKETDGKETTTEILAAESEPVTTQKNIEAPSAPKKEETIPSISYQAHVQYTGWMSNVRDGAVAGTTGEAKRLEGIKITLQDDKGSSMIKYRAHVENSGWQGWKTSGQTAGTESQSKRMEGIQIQLTGAYAEKYDIYYCVHVANFGWLGWAKNGGTAGSEGLSLQAEAIRIKLVKKNEPFSAGGRHNIVKPKITYQAHCAYTGWKSAVSDGKTAGTIGEKRQLEGLKINLADTDGKSGIEYRAHVSNVGWQGWKNSGGLAGTIGESRKLEAVEIKLKGNLVKDFDIYYRMHVAEIGWMGWAKNGETAGTTGGARQAEAIEIRIVGKGASVEREGAAYQKLTQISVAGSASDAVYIASSQVGYYEKASNYNLDDFKANQGHGNYTKYARDLGVANGQPWCTTFMLWCMKQAGVPNSVYPYTTWVPTMRDWFKTRGLFRVRGTYIPKAGDFIIFGSDARHVGMVESVSGGYVHTIEGNTSNDKVERHSFSLSNNYILGYGVVNYSKK